MEGLVGLRRAGLAQRGNEAMLGLLREQPLPGATQAMAGPWGLGAGKTQA